jgi:hypothetical protein
VGIPQWMGFSRPQLVVVSGLFFSIEFWLSRSLSHELFHFFTMEFWLSRSLFHDGIRAITKPFSRTFSFFTMEFGLSQSLSHELFLFSRWNFGYHKAFLTNFFFFHDGIWAITKPFSRTFLFSRWNFGYHKAFLTNFFFFTMEFSRYAIWGKTLFIYISQRVFT